MKIKAAALFIIIFFSSLIYAQSDYIPADNPVYSFLKKCSVKKLISFDDAVLPLTRREVNECLEQLNQQRHDLTFNESGILTKLLEKFSLSGGSSIVSEGLDILPDNTEKNLYRYNDSLLSFTANPILDFTFLHSSGKSAQLLNAGGRIYGSYNSWFGFSAQAGNGVVFGDENTAREDSRVARSFTFNNTGINYFDAVNGHFALHSGIFNFQLGREKVLWGRGNIDRLLISGYSPDFDFLRFSLKYKALQYEFLHGWLVQPVESRYIDSLAGDVKTKSPKYIAINRLGINILSNLNAGITQTIIYSGRPVEAAYLNPFLLWEFAQRSLNDLDNSFLTFDIDWRIINGLSWNASLLIDDVHFGRLFDQGWNIVDNRSALQTGIYFVPPVLPDLSVKLEFSLVRPYTFSHAGIGEALTYTNNSWFLGIPVNPNSVKYSAEFSYLLNPDLELTLTAEHIDHGANGYSDDGSLIYNYGGNIFENLRLADSRVIRQLDGNKEQETILTLKGSLEFVRNFFLDVRYLYNHFESVASKRDKSVIAAALIMALQ